MSVLLSSIHINKAFNTSYCQQECLFKFGKNALSALHEEYVPLNCDAQSLFLSWSIRPRGGSRNDNSFEYSLRCCKGSLMLVLRKCVMKISKEIKTNWFSSSLLQAFKCALCLGNHRLDRVQKRLRKDP